ncbi:MAG: two-component sensor histidine kinase [Gammaproteobacteria bacterium]|nr:two-component sensor histidine kinase [Gammaproteobacteria bacterium]
MLPYLHFLEISLKKQVGKEISIRTSQGTDGTQWFWVDIPISDGILRFGFSRSRIGVEPSLAFFILLVTGLYLTFITAVILTRRLTIPIDRLYRAAQLVGKGRWPDPVQEEGAEELVVLARGFNRMNIQVKELLANRTTLLAGIAHDLRTPLTQIQLALSMLPNEGGDHELMDSIRSDLGVINRLIGETLSISLELAEEKSMPTDIDLELDDIIKKLQTNNVDIEWSRGKPCRQVLQPLALRRVLTNLLENALRYGDGKPVTVSYECQKDAAIIQIMDRGPGIPAEHKEAVFRPFFRLEKSRGSETGGSGLGLAIVRQLADANGWEVQLKPRAGGGTNAVLSIPCH